MIQTLIVLPIHTLLLHVYYHGYLLALANVASCNKGKELTTLEKEAVYFIVF